ncbi:MAG TPA: plastocyanin/azurin family copper-binding protein [Candidatus Kapabacteria bacterium]|nr:plastocyanin/azurin family copper-binding protein [Candidatus Kapabacteria bacterium]
MQQTSGGQKNLVILSVVIVALLIGAVVFAMRSSDQPVVEEKNMAPTTEQEDLNTGGVTSTEPATDEHEGTEGMDHASTSTGTQVGQKTDTTVTVPAPVVSSGVKTFTVSGDNFSFNLKEMRVKKGDRVKVVFVNAKGTHDWVIDEFNARTPILQAGATAEVEFVADKTGQFEYYCSVGSHRQMGMKGLLIVE